MKTFNQNSVIRGAIRRTFARSPLVIEVMNEGKRKVPHYNKDGSRAKVDRVEIHCQVCDTWGPRKGCAIDHKEPVISVEYGFIDWNEFVDRLYCDKSNLQRICKTCHDAKTAKERFERTYKKELAQLNYLNSAIRSSHSTIIKEDVKFLKRFTPKRLAKYPPEFVELALYLKKRIK